jgi:hypothetical protein
MPLVSGNCQNYQNVAVSNQLMNIREVESVLDVTVNVLDELGESVTYTSL